jgi:methionyl aminopeptidase
VSYVSVSSDCAVRHSFSVSEELSGHGIGRNFHCLPLIYHHGKIIVTPVGSISDAFADFFANPKLLGIFSTLANDEEGIMEPGMAFTIEPILCQGSAVGIQWPDKWTITTADGGRSAQFEHTVGLLSIMTSVASIILNGTYFSGPDRHYRGRLRYID